MMTAAHQEPVSIGTSQQREQQSISHQDTIDYMTRLMTTDRTETGDKGDQGDDDCQQETIVNKGVMTIVNTKESSTKIVNEGVTTIVNTKESSERPMTHDTINDNKGER